MKKKIVFPVIAVFLGLLSIGFWQHNAVLETMWDFLVVNEKPHPADVIIVIAGGMERVPYGAELYKQGYAPKLLLSGDQTHYMERQAISDRVPRNDILLETRSWTTLENARYCAEIMRAQGFKSAILVTSPYHTRRAGIIFREFFKDWRLTVCATPYNTSLATGWIKNEPVASKVITEYLKLVYHYLVELPVEKIAGL